MTNQSHVLEAHKEIVVDLLLAPPRQKYHKVKHYFGFFRFFRKNKKIRKFAFFADFWFLRIVPRGTLGGLLNENGSHLEVGMIIA